jgi:glutathione synthase/RimK-type ligase-like ATP-grasp enzyme
MEGEHMVIDPTDATDATDDARARDRGAVTSRVALVSCGEYAHLDEDLPPIVAALGARGVDVVVADWHDAGFAWEDVDLAVIRSTWDYTWHHDRFLSWAERVGALTRLANPAPVVRWNTDKRYLLDLAAAGVPTVPTRIVAPGDDPAGVDDLAPGQEIVVKPVVSAGARDTERYGADQLADARTHVERLQGEGRSVLVQPYLDGIDGHGETGMVFLGDSFSHAFRKGPILVPGNGFVDGLYREEDIAPRTASQAELDVASAALDAVAASVPGVSRRDLLYARVDVAPHDGGPVVLELELVEPSFFCATDAGAADRAAEAIAAALAG